MRYIFGAFVVWILVRKRLAVYSAFVTTDAATSAKGARVGTGPTSGN